MNNSSEKLTKSEVNEIKPNQVHDVIKRVMLADGFDMVFDTTESEGPYIKDSVTGKKYLDFFSFFASWPISHNHPKMKDGLFEKTIAKLAKLNPSNSDIYTVEMAQFVATFERVAMPPEFKRLFLVSGGSLAVENALKTAFDWKVRLNLSRGRGERGSKIIHFKDAFHGRSGYTLSLTNTDPIKYKYFPLFDWPRIENPKCTFPLEGNNLWATVEAEKRACEHIKTILDREADDIAAIIIEPIQGEGGDCQFRPEFFAQLQKFCLQYDVLLIADEVQSGMGLTGKMWSFQHFGFTPDIVSFGKKSQVCGIIVGDRIDIVPDNVFKVSSRINSTWGGSVVDMYRSKRILEIIEEDKLIENAEKTGKYMIDQLYALQKKYPNGLSNVRGKGLMCAFDLQDSTRVDKLRELAYERGLFIIPCGTRSIRLRPVLDIKKENVDEFMKIIDECFSELEKLPWEGSYNF